MSNRKEDSNGFIEIKDNPITKEGVFPYAGWQIDAEGVDPEIIPEKIYQVYRPAAEINNETTINSFKLLPWIDEHNVLGMEKLPGITDPAKKGVLGIIGENIKFKSGYLLANLKIFSSKLADLIKNGKKELSIGYQCEYTKKSGIFKNKAYEFIQRNILGNHVALVDEGRSGPDVSVLDAALKITNFLTCDKLELDYMTEKEKAKDMEEKKDEAKDMEEKSEADEKNGETAKDEDMTPEALNKKIIDLAEKVGGIHEAIKKMEGAKYKKDEEHETAEDEEKKDEAKAMDSKLISMDEKFKKLENKLAALTNERAELPEKLKLAKHLSKYVGDFASDSMNLTDVAKYGAKKLEIDCDSGSEVVAVKSYLSALDKASMHRSGAADSFNSSYQTSGDLSAKVNDFYNKKED